MKSLEGKTAVVTGVWRGISGAIALLPTCAAIIGSLLHFNVAAQDYPNRPITLINPGGSGSSSDRFMRVIATEASKILGQPIVYENRPGANNTLGIGAMRSARPDGYLLSITQDTVLTAQPILNPEFKLELGKDYVPVAVLLDQPLIFVTNSGAPFRDVKGFLAYARANPGKLNFAAIPGSISSLTAAMLLSVTGVSFTIVPYKQSSQQIIDLLEGRVDLMVSATTVKPHIDSGKLVALAAAGGTRWSALPNLPTFGEQGVPVATSAWFSIIAHADTPPDAVLRLNGTFNDARKLPSIRKLESDSDFTPLPYLTPAELAEKIKAQGKAMESAIRKVGLKQ